MKSMGGLIRGIVFLGIAGLLTWFFYSVYIDPNSRVGFIDSDQTSYVKGNGAVVEKRVTQAGREVRFTYPEEGNAYQGGLFVSQEEFDRAQIGDKIPIFYGIHYPQLWIPIRSGKVYYIGIVIAAVVIVLFLTGAYFIYRGLVGDSGNSALSGKPKP
jgi:hypothetical protein